MPLGMEVGLGPGDVVLDGDLAPPKSGTAPLNFLPMSIVVYGWRSGATGKGVGLAINRSRVQNSAEGNAA